MFMNKLFYIFITSIALLGCTNSNKTNDGKPTITVTLEPLKYFTSAIAGDKFDVVSMVPNGSSPETYDPTPQQLVNLSKSVAYFRIGYIGFEQIWMNKLEENNPNLAIFDTSKGVELIVGEESCNNHGHDEHGHSHEGGVDPHIWNSTINASIISQNIYNALCQLSPKDKDYFKEKLDSMNIVFKNLDVQIKGILADADTTFLIYHPALSYYAKEFGLKQISIEKDGKQPTPTSLKKLIDDSKAEKPHVIFVQKEFDTRNAELISNELNLHIVTINPLSFNWQEEMLEPAKALKRYE